MLFHYCVSDENKMQAFYFCAAPKRLAMGRFGRAPFPHAILFNDRRNPSAKRFPD
jgi:hypothetical protein